jgi:hypothetical protein
MSWYLSCAKLSWEVSTKGERLGGRLPTEGVVFGCDMFEETKDPHLSASYSPKEASDVIWILKNSGASARLWVALVELHEFVEKHHFSSNFCGW